MPIGGSASEPEARAQAVTHPAHHASASFARCMYRSQDALPCHTRVPFMANTHAPFLAALTE
jgi:hypothetical protein